MLYNNVQNPYKEMFSDAFSGCLPRVIRLQVVSTRVGGVPEVLPPDLIRMAPPSSRGNICMLNILYLHNQNLHTRDIYILAAYHLYI